MSEELSKASVSPDFGLKKETSEENDEEIRKKRFFMMFVPQSLCTSYNYVDIVIYQKINWSSFPDEE